MNLSSAQQLTLTDLKGLEIDLVIAASGYERRATVVAREIQLLKMRRRLVLGFTDRMVLNRIRNDKIFSRLGYDSIPAEGRSDEVIRTVVKAHFEEVSKRNVTMLVDYTSMTRVWYAGIIDFLKTSSLDVDKVDVYFLYTPSRFAKARPPGPNTYMGPIPGFCSLSLPDKRSALVIGLGYERQRGLGLVEYVEPAETVLLFSDPALDSKFVDEVKRNNRELLTKVDKNNILTYPLADLRTTASILTSLCLSLSDDYRVIVAPLGPKPFTLLCLLLATRYQNFDVWRVSAGEAGPPYDRPPLSPILLCKTTFSH